MYYCDNLYKKSSVAVARGIITTSANYDYPACLLLTFFFAIFAYNELDNTSTHLNSSIIWYFIGYEIKTIF